MKRWKKILVTVCVIFLCTITFGVWQTGSLGKTGTVQAGTDKYHMIEMDGVTWEYAICRVDSGNNPKHWELRDENVITCVKVKLVDANGQVDIVIPDTIDGYPVYQIERGERAVVKDIQIVSIPITVEWIGEEAFRGWVSLREVKFLDKGNLSSTGKEITEEEMYLYHVGDRAFSGCISLTAIPLTHTIFSESMEAGKNIYEFCKGLKQAKISGSGEYAYIPENTFYKSNLDDGIKIDDNIKELCIGEYAFRGCDIKNLDISCDCILESGAFQENMELICAEFKGNIKGEGKKVFQGAFLTEGETSLVFKGEKTILGDYTLAGLKARTISFENPNGEVSLGYRCIFESAVENFQIKNKDITVKEGGLETQKENLTSILFENSGTVFLSDGAFFPFLSYVENRNYPSIDTIEFQCKNVEYRDLSGELTQDWKRTSPFEDTAIIYGEKVEKVSGTVGVYLSTFSSVYIENPMMIHEAGFTRLKPKIYGYSQHREISPNFEKIQKSGLVLTYDEPEIVNTKGLNTELLHVYTVLKDGKQMEIPIGRILKEGELSDIQKEKGYLLEYSEELEEFEGDLSIRVYYQEVSDVLILPVVPKKETGMQVEWCEEYKNNLLDGQSIELEKLVQSVKVFYNDGSVVEETPQVLELNSAMVTVGENTLVVCLKENKDISESIHCQARIPQIRKVEAAYREEYVCYHINDILNNKELVDVRVIMENQKVLANDQLEEDYDISILSYTEDFVTVTVIYQGVKSEPFKIPLERKPEVPTAGTNGQEETDKAETPDSPSGQEEADKAQSTASPSLEEEKVLSTPLASSNPKEADMVNMVTEPAVSRIEPTEQEEDRVVAISPILQKDRVTEGTLVGKELISSIRLIYQSGSSKYIGLSDLEEKELQVSKSYPATADQWNEIEITYMGFSCKVSVWGQKKEDVITGTKNNGTENTRTENKNVSNPQSSISIKSNQSKIKISKKTEYTLLTNKAIKLTLKTENINTMQYQFVVKGKKINTKQWINVKNNCISVKNTKEKYGILYIRYDLPDGTTKIIHTTGFSVDTTVPKANVKKNQSYKKGKTLLFSDGSGVKWAKLDGKKIKSGTKVKTNGKHSLVIVDKAGNKLSISFLVR